jgi:hypothetical protein
MRSNLKAELTRLVQHARQRKQTQTINLDSVRSNQERTYQNIAKLRLSKIIAQTKRAAAKGKTSLLVTKLQIYGRKNSHFKVDNPSGDKLDRDDLKGVYYYLYKLCEDEGLTVEVRSNHDGVGISSWYEFWVYWE